jgi:hypothetical protein
VRLSCVEFFRVPLWSGCSSQAPQYSDRRLDYDNGGTDSPSSVPESGRLGLRELGEDVVSLGRKPFCRLGNITFGQRQSYTINHAVIEVE